MEIYPAYNYCPVPGFYIVEHEGKLAVGGGWWIDNDLPRYYSDLRVSKIDIKEYSLQSSLDTRVLKWDGNIGFLQKPIFGAYYIDVTDWNMVRIYQPIPKPRKSKGRDWRWMPGYIGYEGRWIRTW